VELHSHFPNTPSWRGAHLKKKAQGQLYFTWTKHDTCDIQESNEDNCINFLFTIVINSTQIGRWHKIVIRVGSEVLRITEHLLLLHLHMGSVLKAGVLLALL